MALHTHPLCNIDKRTWRGLQQACTPVGGALEPAHTQTGQMFTPAFLSWLSRCCCNTSPQPEACAFRVSPQISEWHLELQLLLGQGLYLLDEVLEGRLELVPHFPLHLLCVEVVSVVHVLVLSQVRGDLAHLRVELDVRVTSLAEHDGVLGGEERRRNRWIDGSNQSLVRLIQPTFEALFLS